MQSRVVCPAVCPSANGCLHHLQAKRPSQAFCMSRVDRATNSTHPAIQASVADDRVSPHPTLTRAGTLAPGWYHSRATTENRCDGITGHKLKLEYRDSVLMSRPVATNPLQPRMARCEPMWPLETADSASFQPARRIAGAVNFYCEFQES